MLGLTTSLNIVISNYFHKSCMQLYVKVSEIWCTSVSIQFVDYYGIESQLSVGICVHLVCLQYL